MSYVLGITLAAVICLAGGFIAGSIYTRKRGCK